jgi:hypothetical protein
MLFVNVRSFLFGCLVIIILGAVVNVASAGMPKKEALAFDLGELHGKAQIKFKPESFYLKQSNLLNNNNVYDKIILSRSTIDTSLDLLYGEKWYGYDVAEFFFTFRNKGVWGNPRSIAQTTETNIKLLEAVFGEHKHFITRHIVWLREIWLKFSINEAFGLDFERQHNFTLGAFPFELGRGIALGTAFATGPRLLGFYSDNAVDQYAFGYKLSGDILLKKLLYDLYGAILENRSDSLAATALKIRGQEFGKKRNQQRGAGRVNFVIASRLKSYPLQTASTSVAFEPYALYNYAPEQSIEFDADAKSKLATFGLAGEFKFDNFEWGFDTAVNVGHQVVRGWDRNLVEFKNNQGTVTLVNSRVHNGSATGSKTLYIPGSDAQNIVNSAPEDASQNGRKIGNATSVGDLYNDNHRFRNPYVNSYKGWMFVADGIYSFGCDKNVKVAATVGVASGDKNPNQDLDMPNESNVNTDFKGFIGLQEIYAGNRVESVFFLGGTGKAPRPLFIPTSEQVLDRIPSVVSGFTNLIFTGAALHWYPTYGDRKLGIKSDLLLYWQEKATNKFDIQLGRSTNELARNFLGTELNTFFYADLFDNFKIYAVGSVFIPGSHYHDVKGTPLTKDDLKLLDNSDVTGIIIDKNPLLGDNVAYTINFGLEYRF